MSEELDFLSKAFTKEELMEALQLKSQEGEAEKTDIKKANTLPHNETYYKLKEIIRQSNRQKIFASTRFCGSCGQTIPVDIDVVNIEKEVTN